MSDSGLLQQLLQAMQGASVPTPFGWAPMQNAIPSRDMVANVAGWPVDMATQIWRAGDFNTPEVQSRFSHYRTPPMLGSDSIRAMLGGDPTPTPGRAWIAADGSAGPESRATITRGGTPPPTPLPSVFDFLNSPSSWPSALAATATRRGR
jgi:hypothetical protein